MHILLACRGSHIAIETISHVLVSGVLTRACVSFTIAAASTQIRGGDRKPSLFDVGNMFGRSGRITTAKYPILIRIKQNVDAERRTVELMKERSGTCLTRSKLPKGLDIIHNEGWPSPPRWMA